MKTFKLDTELYIGNPREIQAGYPRGRIKKSGVKLEVKEEEGEEEGEAEGDSRV